MTGIDSDGGDPRAFYEQYVEEHVPYHRSPKGLKGAVLSVLPYWSYREWRFWQAFIPPGGRLLDLGCARGREVFRDKSRQAVGVDIARNALRDCLRRYDCATASDLAALPFPDDAFDCVVSSHVLGHVPAVAKDDVLSEIRRVLRAGGRTLHVVETDSRHTLIEEAKRRPDLYRRRLIEPDGHVGLELPSAVLERFARAGFELEHCEPMDAGPLHPRLAVKWFDNEYRECSPLLARVVARARAVLASPARLALEEIRLGLEHRGAGRRRPLDDALFLAVVLRTNKP